MKMFASTSRLLDAILAVAVVIPLSVTGIFSFADSAKAESLIGDFQLSNGFTTSPSIASSLVELSATSLIFSPQPVTPISLSAQTGNFLAFNTANIGNIISFSPLSADNPFLDFGQTLIPGIVQSSADTASITDGINIFTLKSASYALKQSGQNIAVDVALDGFFSSGDETKSQGAGNLTFQINNAQVANVESILSSGGSVKNLAFSGGLFTTTSIPEPATLLGLGMVGGVMAMSRRRKNQDNTINIAEM
ncbi:PEP-CTERM sorting domain-containing protein [Amazonocrinis nigriterrae]|nr:PEP-CTERM sorting domain-containing protein [Amazonocrinis nigriterrae]